jgi:nicotinamidase-related amidase
MTPLPENAVLLIVDVQEGLDDPVWGARSTPTAEQNMARLLQSWRRAGRPIIHVQHLSQIPTSPLRPDRPGVKIKDVVMPLPGEPLIQKQTNSAFIGTDLEQRLRRNGLDTLVIVGLTTPHCVSTTARMSANLGFRTLIVADATAAHELTGHDGRFYTAQEVHDHALAALNNEFAEIVDTEELISQ